MTVLLACLNSDMKLLLTVLSMLIVKKYKVVLRAQMVDEVGDMAAQQLGG